MTELWERFSFYGIRPLIVLFLAAGLDLGGFGLRPEDAAAVAGIFGGCLYLASLPGGLIADKLLGQKNSILLGALIIALGHLSIALSYFYPRIFFLGLGLIVIGTGLFKTCASVMLGLLYSREDPRRDSGFTIFYMGINLGAFIAPLITGLLFERVGYHAGFAAGGLGMLIALLIFWRRTIPDLVKFEREVGIASEWDRPLRPRSLLILLLCLAGLLFVLFFSGLSIDPVLIATNLALAILVCSALYFLYLFFFSSLRAEEKKSLAVFVLLFLTAAIFWSLYEQQYTSFNFFADTLTDKVILGFAVPTAWFQSINPLFILILAPLIALLWVRLARRGLELSSLVKFALGTAGAGLAFIIMFFAARSLDGTLASPWWLISSLLLLTLGELCLSPVGLSLMTKIAPELIKSQVMGLWFVSSSLGNVMAGLIGGHVSEDNAQALPGLFLECAGVLVGVTVILFLLKGPINRLLRGKKG